MHGMELLLLSYPTEFLTFFVVEMGVRNILKYRTYRSSVACLIVPLDQFDLVQVLSPPPPSISLLPVVRYSPIWAKDSVSTLKSSSLQLYVPINI